MSNNSKRILRLQMHVFTNATASPAVMHLNPGSILGRRQRRGGRDPNARTPPKQREQIAFFALIMALSFFTPSGVPANHARSSLMRP